MMNESDVRATEREGWANRASRMKRRPTEMSSYQRRGMGGPSTPEVGLAPIGDPKKDVALPGYDATYTEEEREAEAGRRKKAMAGFPRRGGSELE
jgi:hypothetical protein